MIIMIILMIIMIIHMIVMIILMIIMKMMILDSHDNHGNGNHFGSRLKAPSQIGYGCARASLCSGPLCSLRRYGGWIWERTEADG